MCRDVSHASNISAGVCVCVRISKCTNTQPAAGFTGCSELCEGFIVPSTAV